MKKLITFLAIAIITVNVFAQSPEKMSYQCVVRNVSGGLVTDQSVGVRISILQSTPTGSVVYQETYNPNPQTNVNGLLSLEIGGGFAILGTFSSINWMTGIYFLKTETDPTGGTNYTISGTSQLLSVPYALYAKTSGSVNVAVSATGDTMSFGGTSLIIPGISEANSSTITNIDIDGNVYDTVRIGTQIWMKENLRVTKFNDGTDFPIPDYDYRWDQLITPAYCWYNNDINNKDPYGALYNWWAATSGKLCPVGWHVPSVDEWRIIAPPNGHAGFDLMESGTSHWIAGTGTNTTGFTALPGGVRGNGFSGIGEYGHYWTSDAPNYMYSGFVWNFPIPWDGSWGHTPTSTLINPQIGYSVRCLKNNQAGK